MRLCVASTDHDRLISVYKSILVPTGALNVSIAIHETILGPNLMAFVGGVKEYVRLADPTKPIDHEIIGIELFFDFTSNGIDNQRVLIDIACQRAENVQRIFNRTYYLLRESNNNPVSMGFKPTDKFLPMETYNTDYAVGLARGTVSLGDIELDSSFIAVRSRDGKVAVGSHDSFPHYGSILATLDLDNAREARALASLEIIDNEDEYYRPRVCCCQPLCGTENSLRANIRHMIFGKDNPVSIAYNIFIWITILLSVITVIIDSIPGTNSHVFDMIDYVCMSIFTVELILKLWSAKSVVKYIFSIWGIIDIVSLVPSYVHLFNDRARPFSTVRLMKLLRMFRVLRLGIFKDESSLLHNSLYASRYRVLVFFIGIFFVVLVVSSAVFVAEDGGHNFQSIPQCMYWAIVTIATVGYGDVTPSTSAGKFIASVTILIGYAVLAIPTGIVTVELATTETVMADGNKSPFFINNGPDGLNQGRSTIPGLDKASSLHPNPENLPRNVEIPTNTAPRPSSYLFSGGEGGSYNSQHSSALKRSKCIYCSFDNRHNAQFCASCGQKTNGILDKTEQQVPMSPRLNRLSLKVR